VSSLGLVADARPIVEPFAAGGRNPGVVLENAPPVARTGGQAAVVVQAHDQHEQVTVEGLGLVGTGAEHIVRPGAEGSDLGNGRRGVR